ncbi:MAG TPA: NUDIX domain-containing protein [Candidatus Saccharimonadales bacterium]|nr:NUDIX domain-containing protein [Candidatus Saccharimonadales bacterium]
MKPAVKKADGANAEVILVRADGALILQQRDDKPGMTNPGFISSFGGHIEPGEEPLEAAVREINEETNLQLSPADLKFFGKYRKTKAEHGEDWDVYYFIARNISGAGLEVYEGQGFKVVQNEQELSTLKATKMLQQALKDYWKRFK